MDSDNRNESAPNPIETDISESWTFLGDESTDPIHHQDSGVQDIVEHPDDDDAKLPTKTSRSSSSCMSDNNFLTVTHHGTDGDISDGISVISDCDSISDRHSPMPPRRASPRVDYTEDEDRPNENGIANVQSYSLVERSTANEVQVLTSHNDSQPHSVWWNPSNIILFGLLVGTAAILSSQCWKDHLPHENVVPEMSTLAQRIQDLERENLALKVEVSRLVELHHAGHDHSRTHDDPMVGERSVKQKKVWTGAGDAATHIPKVPVKANYCKDEYLDSDDLFASYNFKKCAENIDDLKKKNVEKDKSKRGQDDRQTTTENRSQQFDTRSKKNFNKTDDSATIKRNKFAETKFKNAENQRPTSETAENVRNEKMIKIQEERQKLFDEATQKYLELQKKMEKKQEKDKKKDAVQASKNDRKLPKDTSEGSANEVKQRKVLRAKGNENMDSEWYDKMMKRREELRAKGNANTDSEWYDKMMKQREELRARGNNSGGTKQKNKENWYTERGNEREKVCGKRDKQTKQSKPYRVDI